MRYINLRFTYLLTYLHEFLGPSCPSQKGHSPSLNFRPMSIVAKRSPISATAEHLFQVLYDLCRHRFY